MKTLRQQLEEAVSQALVQVVGPEGSEIDPVVRPAQDARFGDFQSNVALGLAKRLGKKPREIAESLVEALQLGEMCDPPEIAGPGFINFRVRPQFYARQLEEIQADPRLGVEPVESPQRVIVDYSSPNVAKEMHVGHLRSTIIGDSIARVLEFIGHDVLRLNHVGDWGTQFGMLIQYLREEQPEAAANPDAFHVQELEEFYRAAKRRFDEDEAFAERARKAVVDLQSGDPQARALWTALCAESMRHANEVYDLLGIETGDGPGQLVTRGESFYNSDLPTVVSELQEMGLAVTDQGAVCVFLDGWTNKEGQPLPLIVQKSDGGYKYETTDLAGIRHRVGVEKADRVIYVTDVRQGEHFQKVFQAARKAGWLPEGVSLEHVGFGMILGDDKRPFKTRTGGTVKLVDLLLEAQRRVAEVTGGSEEDEATAETASRRPVLTEEQKQEIARVGGIGAVKYSDLSHNAASDYVFDWDKMVALTGNSAVYMLYAYARVRSIGRKAGIDFEALPADLPILLEHPSEIGLAKALLNFNSAVQQVAQELRPHYLTDYLYALSRAYSTFFDRNTGVRVIDAEPEAVRLSRLRLCDLTARTLKLGLGLLGIQVVEQM